MSVRPRTQHHVDKRFEEIKLTRVQCFLIGTRGRRIKMISRRVKEPPVGDDEDPARRRRRTYSDSTGGVRLLPIDSNDSERVR